MAICIRVKEKVIQNKWRSLAKNKKKSIDEGIHLNAIDIFAR